MKKLTKTEQKYLNMAKMASRIWLEQDIVSFRAFLRRNDRPEICDMILQTFNSNIEKLPGKLTPEQQAKGFEWLVRTQIKNDGTLRKNAFIGQRELDIINNFSHFEFIGLRDINYFSPMPYFVPVYRCHGKENSFFDYSTTSQGQCEVVG